MSVAKRIIPCLDVDAGQVVKGIKFKNLTEVGDPVKLAEAYEEQGADELVFLDISASKEGRQTMYNTIRRTAENLFIPLTVGGGLGNLDDIRKALDSGADKVSINTAAVGDPSVVSEGAEQFGSQCIVVAIDAKRENDHWIVYTHGGSRPTSRKALDWAKKVAKLGAGEILLTSMDADGTQDGYDIELTARISENVDIPVIASGGCGTIDHIYQVLTEGKADAALAASIFHYGTYQVEKVKNKLKDMGVEVRD